ncbi:MAG: hypothetical protein WDN75_18235 [Bacteroidota bacterium]
MTGTSSSINCLSCSTDVISYMIFFLTCLLSNNLLSFLQNVCFALKQGDHAGWPYTYYDPQQKKKMIAPEFGGDGKTEAGSEYIDRSSHFRPILLPMHCCFTQEISSRQNIKTGAFVAFHGSWNRAPEPQKGFLVAFQPFVDGKPSGDWEVFADGFSGSAENTASGRADHRPCGLAQGPDGSFVCKR